MNTHQLIAQVTVPGPGGGYTVKDPFHFVYIGGSAYISSVIFDILKYGFVFAGILLFIFISKAGFSLMTSGGDPKKIEQAKSDLTSSLIGFFIVFGSYWIFVIVKYIYGIV